MRICAVYLEIIDTYKWRTKLLTTLNGHGQSGWSPIGCEGFHTNLNIQSPLSTYIRTYIHACMHACMHAYIHTYTHTHTYIHTYIYTYIHIYIILILLFLLLELFLLYLYKQVCKRTACSLESSPSKPPSPGLPPPGSFPWPKSGMTIWI